MKKTVTIILICFSLVSFGQKKDSTMKTSPGTVMPQQDTSNYVLVGKLQDFQLLLVAISSPGDVTPNQVNALVAWIRKIQLLPEPKKK